MGYHAPSAEEVYRYVFRVDQPTKQGLTDGFGWSILFVNDNSPVCKDFLLMYGAELAQRTADRIRFVFFSGLEYNEMDELVGKASSSGDGFLPRLLSVIARGGFAHRRLDWERDQWDRLRPDAFRPLDSAQQMDRQLRFECQIHTSMPGAREALRFAQRLGLGRFVPCFILFRDSGDPLVRLLPVRDYSADRIYLRLRGWIDSFYEINNSVLERWTRIEAEIKDLCRTLHSSIQKVDDWKQEHSSQWRDLQRLSACLAVLRRTSPDTAVLNKISDDWTITWDVRKVIQSAQSRFKSLAHNQAEARQATVWVDTLLSESDDPSIVRRELFGFRQQYAATISVGIKHILDEAAQLFEPGLASQSPEQQLYSWWRSEFGRPPSRNQFDKHRHAWLSYSKRKHGDGIRGQVASALREEFTTVVEAVLAQPVTRDPEDAADDVVASLGSYFGVPPAEATWTTVVSQYRDSLAGMFAEWKTHNPRWVMSVVQPLLPQLCWGDCIPTIEQRQSAGRGLTVALCPSLVPILQQVQLDSNRQAAQAEEERQSQQRRALQRLGTAIHDWYSGTSLLDADKLSIWMALVSSLSARVDKLANRLLLDAKTIGSTSYPGGSIPQEATDQLVRLLGEYDAAVSTLQFPFEWDQDVLRVAADASLIEASGIAMPELATSPHERAKSELLKAVSEAQASATRWPILKQEAIAWNPAGALIASLREIVSERRIRELFAGTGHGDEEAWARLLTGRSEIARFLESLTAQELLAVYRALAGDEDHENVPPSSKQDLFGSILVAIGLPSASDRDRGSSPTDQGSIAASLDDKIRHDAFDVFLAHCSQDKPAVLRLGHLLRDRGIYPWIDVEQIPPGRWFQDVIQSAARRVKAAAIIVGPSAFGRWEAVELRVFFSRCVNEAIPLIPVLLPGVDTLPDDLIFLRELNWVRFSRDIGEEDAISKLVWGITGHAHGTTT